MDKHADHRPTIDLTDIRPLSDFQRNAKAHVQRMRRSGSATVFTVNGRASLVMQDVSAYQQMVAAFEQAELLLAAREGIAQAKAGDTETLAAFDKRMRRKHGFGPRGRK